jgi:hypothetical protein
MTGHASQRILSEVAAAAVDSVSMNKLTNGKGLVRIRMMLRAARKAVKRVSQQKAPLPIKTAANFALKAKLARLYANGILEIHQRNGAAIDRTVTMNITRS